MTRNNNFEKLKAVLSLVIKIVLWVFGVSVLITSIILGVLDENLTFQIISSIISVISICFAILWSLFERKLWENKHIIKHLPEKYYTPSLKGRWEGTLIRNGIEHKFVLEIKQTYTNISCITYSKHSSSKSIVAEILYNDEHKNYELVFYWYCETSNVKKQIGEFVGFYGFTKLNINIQNRKCVELTGEYFTNRQPKQTMGQIKFNNRQETLKNKF